MRVCSVHGCPTLYPTTEGSRCHAHRAEADRRRGTTSERGYSTRGHRSFRTAVLHADPVCVLCQLRPSTVADHYPHSRRELVELGLDPNALQYGRGLCAQCHNESTAREQPGGWHKA